MITSEMSWRRLGHIASVRGGDSVVDHMEVGSVPIYGAGGLLGFTNEANASAGEVIVGRVGSVGSLRLLSSRAWATDNTLLISFDVQSVEPRFAIYALREISVAQITSGTAMPLVTGSALLRQTIPLPPLDGQRAIANYLDRETARVDAFIEEQKRLIALLRERRAAVLVDAFASMKGEASMLDRQPIAWLPDLRVNQAQMRHLCRVGTGSSDSANAVDEGYPFFVRGDQPLALDTYEFDTEAIITAGDGAMVGRSFHHYRGKFAAHQRVYVLRDFVGVDPRYLFWYFSTFFIRVVGDGGAQATVPSVRMPMIAGMPVPVPALGEQRRIAAYLDEQTAKIDALIAEMERLVELSRERQTALITTTVTGQIDVPAVA